MSMFAKKRSLQTEPLAAGHGSGDVSAAEAITPFVAPPFEAVYEQLFDFVWRSARRLGVADAAVDDVVQETFLVVHRRLPGFEGRSTVKTWVFAIVLRVVSDWRRTQRRKGGLASLDQIAPDGEMPDDRAT